MKMVAHLIINGVTGEVGYIELTKQMLKVTD